MQQFLIYEGKVAVIMTVFYLFFRVMLSKEKLHRLNRAVLVCTVLVPFLLPLCVITVHKTLPAPALAAVEAGESLAESLPEAIVTKVPFNWWGLLTIVYFLGVVASLAKIGVDLINLKRLISKGEHHKDESGNVVVVLDEDVSPFSWMSFIFLSREDYEANCNHILEHERAHIRLGHAKELFCMELLSSLQWFSPAMWYLKSDLKAIYEYEADDAVLRCGANIKEYQYSLIRKAVSTSGYTITNSFNHSILKNRITMMSKSKTPLTRSLKVLYVLPLLCGALVLNARTVVDYENTEIPTTVQQTPDGESVPFQNVEVKPTFQGGDANQFSKWVNENLRYPEDAKAAKIQGRVTLSFTVTKTGKVADVKVLRGADPALDAEAVRVVSASPDWTPGEVKGEKVNVTYTFPVIFQVRDNAGNQVEPGVVNDVFVIGYGSKADKQDIVKSEETPVSFSSLTKTPTFNGGDANEFSMWINRQLIYPESAKAAGVQGKVTVSFKVNSDGKVSDVNVLRGVCDALDNEAIRLVSSSPNWTPGEVNGKPVAVTYTFPITFSLR